MDSTRSAVSAPLRPPLLASGPAIPGRQPRVRPPTRRPALAPRSARCSSTTWLPARSPIPLTTSAGTASSPKHAKKHHKHHTHAISRARPTPRLCTSATRQAAPRRSRPATRGLSSDAVLIPITARRLHPTRNAAPISFFGGSAAAGSHHFLEDRRERVRRHAEFSPERIVHRGRQEDQECDEDSQDRNADSYHSFPSAATDSVLLKRSVAAKMNETTAERIRRSRPMRAVPTRGSRVMSGQ